MALVGRLQPGEELSCLRLRTKRIEIMIAPGETIGNRGIRVLEIVTRRRILDCGCPEVSRK